MRTYHNGNLDGAMLGTDVTQVLRCLSGVEIERLPGFHEANRAQSDAHGVLVVRHSRVPGAAQHAAQMPCLWREFAVVNKAHDGADIDSLA